MRSRRSEAHRRVTRRIVLPGGVEVAGSGVTLVVFRALAADVIARRRGGLGHRLCWFPRGGVVKSGPRVTKAPRGESFRGSACQHGRLRFRTSRQMSKSSAGVNGHVYDQLRSGE